MVSKLTPSLVKFIKIKKKLGERETLKAMDKMTPPRGDLPKNMIY